MKALRLAAAYVTAAALVAYALVSACTDAAITNYCTNIPAHGCPGDDGTNCKDTTCEAIYARGDDCAWTLVQTCASYQPDAGRDASGVDAADAHDAPLRDAGFALPPGAGGGPGCEDLELPDCPLELAFSCADCCGCQDLYVCVDAGWNIWGACSDAGVPEMDP